MGEGGVGVQPWRHQASRAPKLSDSCSAANALEFCYGKTPAITVPWPPELPPEASKAFRFTWKLEMEVTSK